MNPLLKTAYDYGCQRAVEDLEKAAGIPPALFRPAVGALAGGYIGAEAAGEGNRLKGLLYGAGAGAGLGVLAHRLRSGGKAREIIGDLIDASLDSIWLD
jgi:hypothetical protein